MGRESVPDSVGAVLARVGVEAFESGGDEAGFAESAMSAIGVFGGRRDEVVEGEGLSEDFFEAFAEVFSDEVLGEVIDEGVGGDEEGGGGLDVGLGEPLKEGDEGVPRGVRCSAIDEGVEVEIALDGKIEELAVGGG